MISDVSDLSYLLHWIQTHLFKFLHVLPSRKILEDIGSSSADGKALPPGSPAGDEIPLSSNYCKV